MTTSSQALYFVHALTPLHVGADQGIGAIDLPTMREAHTGWPILPGSSLKGVLREQAEATFGRDSAEVLGVYGPPTERAGDFRGGVVFGDAWPLLVPVRSLAGTFAWITCHQALRRLAREGREAGLKLEVCHPPALPGVLHLPDPKDVVSALVVGDCVLLDDLFLSVQHALEVGMLAGKFAAWIWPNDTDAKAFLTQRLALVHDDVFAHFCRHGLEVRARVAIDRGTGTVAQGPWTEEHIPAETVLCGLVRARGTVVRLRRRPDAEDGRNVPEADLHQDSPVTPAAALDSLRRALLAVGTLRFGGHASVGLGRARLTLAQATATSPPPQAARPEPPRGSNGGRR